VHVLLRPGVTYGIQEVGDTDTYSVFGASGEVEAEVFLVNNVSVSAAFGLAYATATLPSEITGLTSDTTVTSFESTGFDFTSTPR
jgi:hypothetical protein